jgi:hypothetical protein
MSGAGPASGSGADLFCFFCRISASESLRNVTSCRIAGHTFVQSVSCHLVADAASTFAANLDEKGQHEATPGNCSERDETGPDRGGIAVDD